MEEDVKPVIDTSVIATIHEEDPQDYDLDEVESPELDKSDFDLDEITDEDEPIEVEQEDVHPDDNRPDERAKVKQEVRKRVIKMMGADNIVRVVIMAIRGGGNVSLSQVGPFRLEF